MRSWRLPPAVPASSEAARKFVPTSGRTLMREPRFGPKFGELWPTSFCSGRVWQTLAQTRPNLADVGRRPTDVGQKRPSFRKHPMMGDSNMGPTLTQLRQCCQKPAEGWPTSPKVGRQWSDGGQHQPRHGQARPDLVEVGPNLGYQSIFRLSSGQLRSSPGSPGVTLRGAWRTPGATFRDSWRTMLR